MSVDLSKFNGRRKWGKKQNCGDCIYKIYEETNDRSVCFLFSSPANGQLLQIETAWDQRCMGTAKREAEEVE